MLHCTVTEENIYIQNSLLKQGCLRRGSNPGLDCLSARCLPLTYLPNSWAKEQAFFWQFPRALRWDESDPGCLEQEPRSTPRRAIALPVHQILSSPTDLARIKQSADRVSWLAINDARYWGRLASMWLCDLVSYLKLEKMKYLMKWSVQNFYKTWQPMIRLWWRTWSWRGV